MPDFGKIGRDIRRFRAYAFYYIGAIMVVTALVLAPVFLATGDMSWMAAGIVAANVAGGSLMHLVGRYLLSTYRAD